MLIYWKFKVVGVIYEQIYIYGYVNMSLEFNIKEFIMEGIMEKGVGGGGQPPLEVGFSLCPERYWAMPNTYFGQVPGHQKYYVMPTTGGSIYYQARQGTWPGKLIWMTKYYVMPGTMPRLATPLKAE
jgi:hypothetical protein